MKRGQMVGLLTMTSGVSLAGIWAYKRLGDKKQKRWDKDAEPSWWKTSWQSVQETLQSGCRRLTPRNFRSSAAPVLSNPPLTFAPYRADPSEPIRYGWRTSALALGVTTTAAIIFPPLQIVGLPLLIYLGIPPAQAAYEQLLVDNRPGRALAETLVLAVCLAAGYYWIGSLGFCLYYGSRTLLAAPRLDEDAQQSQWLAPTTYLWKDGATCAVPTATLQQGDQVILHSGEQAPVDGLITEGVAWLQPQALASATYGLHKGVGDRIAVTDLVLVGRICVRVLPTT